MDEWLKFGREYGLPMTMVCWFLWRDYQREKDSRVREEKMIERYDKMNSRHAKTNRVFLRKLNQISTHIAGLQNSFVTELNNIASIMARLGIAIDQRAKQHEKELKQEKNATERELARKTGGYAIIKKEDEP